MIITEHRLRDIVSEIPAMNLNADYLAIKAKFGWGDKYELNRYLELKKNDSYPLIWLLPSDEKHIENGLLCQKQCTLIIAMLETNVSLFNDERYLKSFDLVLNPLTNYLVEGLRISNISEIVDDEWNTFKRPNYSEAKYGKPEETNNKTIDLWDAVELTCSIEFNNETLKPITWQS